MCTTIYIAKKYKEIYKSLNIETISFYPGKIILEIHHCMFHIKCVFDLVSTFCISFDVYILITIYCS